MPRLPCHTIAPKCSHSCAYGNLANGERQPKLYPSKEQYERVEAYTNKPFICVAPNSVWFTKQYPDFQWIAFIKNIPAGHGIYLLGGPGDTALCQAIMESCNRSDLKLLAGSLSFLQSAALMSRARMNYVNDSAPMHFASSVNAPVTAVYCSTLPSFGFGPVSDASFIVETKEPLACRPCGLHGRKVCPLGHFKCAYTIRDEQLLETIS